MKFFFFKTVQNAASHDFGWNLSRTVCVRTTIFSPRNGDDWPDKSAGYDITSSFRSVARRNYIGPTAQKCVKRVRSAHSRLIRPLFNIRSPNFTRISMPACYTATPVMTSSAASGRHFSKFEKAVENAASYALVSNFSGSGAAFCLPHQQVGFLFNSTNQHDSGLVLIPNHQKNSVTVNGV